jgi:molecular chaperone HscB
LQATDFEIFQIPAKAAVDLTALSTRWRELQAQAHPDRFAASGTAAVRVAMQHSARINEAYQRLRVAHTRFAYLCELNHVPIQAHTNTAMPPEFLMQQMVWRESLDEAESEEEVEALRREVQALQCELEQECVVSIDEQQDFVRAAEKVRALMFVTRFLSDIDKKIDQLESSQS